MKDYMTAWNNPGYITNTSSAISSFKQCPFQYSTAHTHTHRHDQGEPTWKHFPVCVFFLVLCTAGTSMLYCWPSAWNEECLMPLVCLEGLSLSRRWTAMHYWLQNTPAMLFHLSSTADRELSFILERLRFSLPQCVHLFTVAVLFL